MPSRTLKTWCGTFIIVQDIGCMDSVADGAYDDMLVTQVCQAQKYSKHLEGVGVDLVR